MKVKLKFDIESFALDKVLLEIKAIAQAKKKEKITEVDPSKIFKPGKRKET